MNWGNLWPDDMWAEALKFKASVPESTQRTYFATTTIAGRTSRPFSS